jgi:hypothetical protein
MLILFINMMHFIFMIYKLINLLQLISFIIMKSLLIDFILIYIILNKLL